MGGVNYYNNRVNRNSNQVASSFSTGSCINLKMTDEDSGSRALTSVGYPDGSSVSVFKAEGYTDGNPQYMVKRWGKDGEETEYFVNPTQVQPEDDNITIWLVIYHSNDFMSVWNNFNCL